MYNYVQLLSRPGTQFDQSYCHNLLLILREEEELYYIRPLGAMICRTNQGTAMSIHTRLPVEIFADVNVHVLRKRFKTFSMLS